MIPADLLAPKGPLEPELFRDEGDGSGGTELNTRLAEYIVQAIAKTSVTSAQRAWALYLAFNAAYIIAISNPADVNFQVDILGSEGYDTDQREALQSKALEYLADYEVAKIAETDEVSRTPQSRVVQNVFAY